MRYSMIILPLLAVVGTAYAQSLDCNLSAAVPPTVRAEGEAEPIGDILVLCTGGTPGASTPIHLTVALNTNLTSRIFGTSPVMSEALLLIDEPLPDSVNMSNGFPYNGQVLGKSGIPAGTSGSGNVYLGRQVSETSVGWYAMPFVAPGPGQMRVIRITNLRANASTLPLDPVGEVVATVSSTLPIHDNQPLTNAFVVPGLNFSAMIVSPDTANLMFAESFATAFSKRIENTPAGPFSMSRQDIPGMIYNTDSQFTPCFSYGNCANTAPGSSLGRADNGTRLLARITGLGGSAAFVSVPNQILASGGSEPRLEAWLIAGGQLVTVPGNTPLPVANGSVHMLYAVTAAFPYAGIQGSFEMNTFTIPAVLLDSSSAPLAYPAQTAFAGFLAPLDSTGTASATAPEPRFARPN